MKRALRLTTLLTPVTAWLVLFSLVPLGVMAVYSFQGSALGAADGVFTLGNYQRFFANSSFQSVLWRSTWIAVLTAVFSVGLAYPLAYYLVFQAGRSRVTLLTLIIAPAWTSELLRILAWKLLLGSNGGINYLLGLLGLVKEGTSLLQFGPATVVLTLVYTWVPFAALPIFAALDRVDRSLLEAAADLGDSPIRSFMRVTFPLSLPGVVAAFFFVFIPSLGEWVTPALVGGTSGIMFGNLIQDQFARALNWPLGAAFSLVMLTMALILTLIMTRFVRLSELLEGV
ncbi:MAG: ABC transporter permease [Anaerolineae bacterium]|nr:ABC transporter permease [Anaerolineae bacterium]